MFGENEDFQIYLRQEQDGYSEREKWVAYDKNPLTDRNSGVRREEGDSQREAAFKLLASMGKINILEWTKLTDVI